MTIFRQFSFDSAHYLPNVPTGHKCRNMHGHTYQLTVYINGPLDPDGGWVMDFSIVKEIVGNALTRIDHKLLNEVEGLDNPTCENLAIWLWKTIKPVMPLLDEIRLNETPASGVIYKG